MRGAINPGGLLGLFTMTTRFWILLILLTMSTPFVSALKTILVLGGSYGGEHLLFVSLCGWWMYVSIGIAASKFLVKDLPEGYRVVLLERNRYIFYYFLITLD
jgi:hypothetical protein